MNIKQTAPNRIECTLSPEELAERSLRLSDLSYGTDKSRSLVEEIMRNASITFEFERTDLPLVVEAVPMESGSLTVIVTKLEYPEELDTRFSRFTPVDESAYPPEPYIDDESMPPVRNPEDLFSTLDRMAREVTRASQGDASDSKDPKAGSAGFGSMIYAFASMEDLIALARLMAPMCSLPASLYRTGRTGAILLMVSPGDYSPKEFRAYCDIISEYSSKDRRPYGSDSLLAEHYSPILDKNALEVLAGL